MKKVILGLAALILSACPGKIEREGEEETYGYVAMEKNLIHEFVTSTGYPCSDFPITCNDLIEYGISSPGGKMQANYDYKAEEMYTLKINGRIIPPREEIGGKSAKQWFKEGKRQCVRLCSKLEVREKFYERMHKQAKTKEIEKELEKIMRSYDSAPEKDYNLEYYFRLNNLFKLI